MNEDLAAAFHAIDPAVLGARIRNARTLAGKTQADLAADEVTAAYLSRIEAGQRKPDFHLLARIAERADTTLAALLAPDEEDDREVEFQVRIDHAELALASGQADLALTQVAEVLPSLEAIGSPPVLIRAAARVRARALEAKGRLNEAVLALEDLTRDAPGDLDWIKDLIALSRCYRESGDLGRAIAAGEQAEDLIHERGLSGLTEAIQLSVTVSAAYVVKGDLDHAMRLCMRAVEEADKHGSPIGRASAYWEASVIESNQGRHADALELARKSLAAFEVADDARNLARIRLLVSMIQLKLDPPDARGALDTLDHVKAELDWAPVSALDRSRAELTRARAHYLLGHYHEADTGLADCLALLPEDAVFVRASALALTGQVALAAGDRDKAHKGVTAAVRALTAVGADREAAQLWYELGTMLEELGDTTRALEAFRRAAASTGLHPHTASHLAKTRSDSAQAQ